MMTTLRTTSLILLFFWNYGLVHCQTCDSGWTLVEEKCLKFSTEKATFYDATTACSDIGGRLIEIHNANASEATAESASTAFGVDQPDFWIGITDQQNHGSWVFNSTGVLIKNVNWDQTDNGQPDNWSKFEHCVHVFGTNGYWYDELCNIKKHYVCEDTNDEILFWRSCPIDWDLINKKCYHKASSKLPYNQAVTYCEGQNAKLFEPSYNKQEEMVINFYSVNMSYWLGANDISNEGR